MRSSERTPVSKGNRKSLRESIAAVLTYFNGGPKTIPDPIEDRSYVRSYGPYIDPRSIALILRETSAFWPGGEMPEWFSRLGFRRREEIVRQECVKLEKWGAAWTNGNRPMGYRIIDVDQDRRDFNERMATALDRIATALESIAEQEWRPGLIRAGVVEIVGLNQYADVRPYWGQKEEDLLAAARTLVSGLEMRKRGVQFGYQRAKDRRLKQQTYQHKLPKVGPLARWTSDKALPEGARR